MSRTTPLCVFLIPCYNEEVGLRYVMDSLSKVMDKYKNNKLIHNDSFICYVDDGSKDSTWKIIETYTSENLSSYALKLAGNVGHQNALLAGMLEMPPNIDCIISLDADLQDDITTIERMLQRFAEGYDIVYGVRDDRSKDSYFKRFSAGWFYKIMELLNVKLIPQHADFRLVGRNAVNALSDFGESNLFLRGIFPSMGFKHTTERYARLERKFGETKYPLRKMLSFAWQGITSFSAAPLRLAGMLSLGTFILAILESLRALYSWWQGDAIAGWTSLTITILFLGAIQLFSLAVIGEYLAKIFVEVKKRPRYIVEKRLDHTRSHLKINS